MRSTALERYAVGLYRHAQGGSDGQKAVLWFLFWPLLLAVRFSVPDLTQPARTSSPPKPRAWLQPRAEGRPTPT